MNGEEGDESEEEEEEEESEEEEDEENDSEFDDPSDYVDNVTDEGKPCPTTRLLQYDPCCSFRPSCRHYPLPCYTLISSLVLCTMMISPSN